MGFSKDNRITFVEAAEDFSRATRLADEYGAAVIFENNAPRYLLIDIGNAECDRLADDETVLALSKRIIAENREAYKALSE